MLRLTVLGSGTCVPRRRRGPAGYAVEAGDALVLLDSGSGTLGRLAQAELDYRQLTHAVYTHVHPDHTADLPPLLFALNYTPGFERQRILHLLGPPGFADFLERLTAAWPWIAPLGDWLSLDEIIDQRIEFPDLALAAAAVTHADLCANAYRIEKDGVSVVFSGDTSYCQSLVELARGADLLVIEASVPLASNEPSPHLSAAEAGQVASEAAAKAVVLTHLYPACDEHDMAALCGEAYRGPILVADDLMAVEVKAAGIERVR